MNNTQITARLVAGESPFQIANAGGHFDVVVMNTAIALNREVTAPLLCSHEYVAGNGGFTCVSCGDHQVTLPAGARIFSTLGDF